MSDERLDVLLKTELLRPPAGFAEGVMARIAALPEPLPAARPSRIRELVEWFALSGAVLAGMSQLAAFVFSIWAVTNAV